MGLFNALSRVTLFRTHQRSHNSHRPPEENKRVDKGPGQEQRYHAGERSEKDLRNKYFAQAADLKMSIGESALVHYMRNGGVHSEEVKLKSFNQGFMDSTNPYDLTRIIGRQGKTDYTFSTKNPNRIVVKIFDKDGRVIFENPNFRDQHKYQKIVKQGGLEKNHLGEKVLLFLLVTPLLGLSAYSFSSYLTGYSILQHISVRPNVFGVSFLILALTGIFLYVKIRKD